ncbi:DUF294 nucleotidyltransferase-like domain-containing protein [Marinomonas pollencensis]|uniref:Cyclic nucleotide-binding protein n=1 Tax=Marinomonas pollencensis TaxID=491954 RepID=A0A3E0DKN2_9GAMM|nr:DUF294 nucleotidyltransferase-like domain-containing protein [Marinomonas pollencensis]REG82632.1 cyclic nucleotide-binding protein [Marinomonas pollencensis]
MAAIDVSEVQKFLYSTPPFANLSSAQMASILNGMEVSYVRQGQTLTLAGAAATLHLIRRGACEIRTPNGALVDQIADGECFGVSSVLAQNPDGLEIVAMEDSLVYRFAKASFLQVFEQSEALRLFFEHTQHHRSRKLSRTQGSDINTPALQLSTPIEQVMTRQLIKATPEESVQIAAQRMTEARVSSILIVDAKEEHKPLVGIVTDRDLRSRVLALGITSELSLSEVMTCAPATLSPDSLVMQAQTLMSEYNIHHLPVVTGDGVPVGMVTAADLLRHQELSPILLINQIHRQTTVENLARVCQQWPTLIVNLILTDMKPADIGKVLAAVSDNLTRRLIELAIAKFGQPPFPFQFLVFGSQARKDQSLGSDQDNGLMLSSPPNAQQSEYFSALSNYVCEGLGACGIRLCPGNIMASNPDWRMTQEQWQQAFSNWITSAAPSALLNASIFFDIRCVYGDEKALTDLLKGMQKDIAKNSLFLVSLTRSALASKPPLGFFRHFLLESSGEHKHQLDLKHQGLALINDIARLYGVACQTYRVGTIPRLEQAIREKLISEDIARNLIDAWDELNGLRLEAQRRHWQAAGKASAYLDPSTLSPLERKHLKATFATIKEAQEIVLQRFARGYA